MIAVLLHARCASGVPPGGVILRRKGAVDVLLALGKGLFVADDAQPILRGYVTGTVT
jgi:hypothetical protein